MNYDKSHYIWLERYRPTALDDIVLDAATKLSVKKWVEDGEIPNILLSSNKPGTGKSSLAHVIIHSLGAEALFINASLESNIDVLRSKIQSFSTTSSFDGRPKLVVLDEADGLANKTQDALRSFLETFSKNVRFILTANNNTKLIEPLRDRLIEIDFDEMFHLHKHLVKDIAIRTMDILKNEKVQFENEDVVFLVKHFYPSSRSIIKKLQQYSISGKLVVDRDAVDSEGNIQKIINTIISKDFVQLRKDITSLHDTSVLFSEIYNHIDMFPKPLHPPIIIAVAKYQSFDIVVRDKLVNCAAMGAEVMQILSKKGI